jgi:ATPase subunit of ABC transporter with duplicated ATPase domains
MMAKLSEISFMLKQLAGAYNQEVTAEQARAYHSVLHRYPRMVLVAAITNLMEKSTFFPRISEIVKIADQVNSGYSEPDWAKFDEATRWYLYTHSMISPDELSEADVEKICKDAGVDQERDARPVRELSAAEVRAVCQARGLPVSRRVELRQAEPVLH